MRATGQLVILGIAAALWVPGPATAQVASWHEVQITDLETMKDKFIGLAEEFTPEQYDWRPMEGVRSVKDVLALMIAECHMFPTSWGHEPPSGAASGFGPEMQRVGAMSRSEILAALGPAFDHMIGIVRGMDDGERMAESAYFGRQMPTHANIATAMADMHEHLGQLIAYARTNEVVPPWSR